jgi:hypothetical protein
LSASLKLYATTSSSCFFLVMRGVHWLYEGKVITVCRGIITLLGPWNSGVCAIISLGLNARQIARCQKDHVRSDSRLSSHCASRIAAAINYWLISFGFLLLMMGSLMVTTDSRTRSQHWTGFEAISEILGEIRIG